MPSDKAATGNPGTNPGGAPAPNDTDTGPSSSGADTAATDATRERATKVHPRAPKGISAPNPPTDEGGGVGVRQGDVPK